MPYSFSFESPCIQIDYLWWHSHILWNAFCNTCLHYFPKSHVDFFLEKILPLYLLSSSYITSNVFTEVQQSSIFLIWNTEFKGTKKEKMFPPTQKKHKFADIAEKTRRKGTFWQPEMSGGIFLPEDWGSTGKNKNSVRDAIVIATGGWKQSAEKINDSDTCFCLNDELWKFNRVTFFKAEICVCESCDFILIKN